MTASTSTIRFGRLAASAFTRDIQASSAFYRDVLGFETVFQNGDPVGFMILEKDEAELHLSLVKDHTPSTANIAHLLVDDVDALHARLVAAGTRIIKSLADKDYGLRAFVFADPDGNRIDVGQPTGPVANPAIHVERRRAPGSTFRDVGLAQAVFDDVNLADARFLNVNLAGARLEDVNLSGVTIDNANIKGLTIFGIDIHALVQEALKRGG
jgi:catechol 2,3-dioxygenase-like lactoylglutathione lyase family enzyme